MTRVESKVVKVEAKEQEPKPEVKAEHKIEVKTQPQASSHGTPRTEPQVSRKSEEVVKQVEVKLDKTAESLPSSKQVTAVTAAAA